MKYLHLFFMMAFLCQPWYVDGQNSMGSPLEYDKFVQTQTYTTGQALSRLDEKIQSGKAEEIKQEYNNYVNKVNTSVDNLKKAGAYKNEVQYHKAALTYLEFYQTMGTGGLRYIVNTMTKASRTDTEETAIVKKYDSLKKAELGARQHFETERAKFVEKYDLESANFCHDIGVMKGQIERSFTDLKGKPLGSKGDMFYTAGYLTGSTEGLITYTQQFESCEFTFYSGADTAEARRIYNELDTRLRSCLSNEWQRAGHSIPALSEEKVTYRYMSGNNTSTGEGNAIQLIKETFGSNSRYSKVKLEFRKNKAQTSKARK